MSEKIAGKTGDLRIERGSLADWKALAHFHYMSAGVGAVDKIFRIRQGDETVGVVVYAYPAPNNQVRRRVFAGRYSSHVAMRERRQLLNREMRVVRRVVIVPRLRGRGLASRLLRETLPLLDMPFVECISASSTREGDMRGANFLERAGFGCMGHCELPRPGCELLGALRELGVTEAVIHDGPALAPILREILTGFPEVGAMLERWWRAKKLKIPCLLDGDLEAVAVEVARRLTSWPFYYLWINKEKS